VRRTNFHSFVYSQIFPRSKRCKQVLIPNFWFTINYLLTASDQSCTKTGYQKIPTKNCMWQSKKNSWTFSAATKWHNTHVNIHVWARVDMYAKNVNIHFGVSTYLVYRVKAIRVQSIQWLFQFSVLGTLGCCNMKCEWTLNFVYD
jgi:hypothetical protein